MRVVLAFIVAVSLTVAPIVAVAATSCAHAPASADHDGHAMTGHADMQFGSAHAPADDEGVSVSTCDCDPGCADHCGGATPAAAVLSATPVPATAVVSPISRLAYRAHVNPPPGAPLRPPKTPIA